MPRYFFHVMNNRAIPDTVGMELGDFSAVRAQAVKIAGEILASEGDRFWRDGSWRMSVADETGKVHLTLDFAARAHEQ